MNKVIKILTEIDCDKMIENVDLPQNVRCKINTGYVCNLNCFFCYFHSKRDTCNYSIESIKQQLDIAKSYGVESVDFSGGEPTIHPDFISALEYANQLGFKNICCVTNGMRFDNLLYLKECVEAGLNDILFSLHGTEHLHNYITRVEGSYDKLVEGIVNSHLCGIKPRVNTVVIKNNYRNLKMLASDLVDHSVKQWNMIIYKMQYDCGDPERDNFVSHLQSSPIIKQAIDIAKPHVKLINVRYIPFCFMRGYEKYVTNYPQKRYDPYEWSNYLLQGFEMGEDHLLQMQNNPVDIIRCNANVIKGNRLGYKKPFKCGTCRDYLICDGFEEGYVKRGSTDEATPFKGEPIRNPLHYRGSYGT